MSMAEEEQFEEMISALDTLKREILESCEAIRTCAEVCAAEMSEDDLSSNARDRVSQCEQAIRNKTTDITSFQRELAEKLEQLRELRRRSQEV